MVALLKARGDNLTRENLMKQAASIRDLKLPMLLPGIALSTSADDYQPIKQMQLQKFDGTTWKLFGESFPAPAVRYLIRKGLEWPSISAKGGHHDNQTQHHERSVSGRFCCRQQSCLRRRPIRTRRQRQRDQDRQHHAVQRPGFRLRHHRQDRSRLLHHDQRERRHQWPQDQLHQPRRRLQPAENRRAGAATGRARSGALVFSRSEHRPTSPSTLT